MDGHVSATRIAALLAVGLAITACDTPAGPTTGTLTVTVLGLPSSANAAVTLTGPNIAGQLITHTRTLSDLVPGTYVVSAADVDADEIYHASVPSQTVAVTASQTPLGITIDYRATTGTLNLAGVGLPAQAAPVFDVRGPQNFSKSFSGSRLVSKLVPGDYTISARAVTDNSVIYTATNSPLIVTVAAGASALAGANYVRAVGTLDLRIDGAYVTQSVQRYDGSVPLVAGRTGYLRIFAVANETNAAAPAVRLRLFSNGSLASTRILAARAAGVPLSPDQGSTTRSWSVPIEGSLIQAGFGFLVDVDPDNSVPEIDESDNAFPATGLPRIQTVQAVAPLNVRFVPILTSVNGQTGSVTDANKASYLETALRMYPLSTYSADIRAPFTTSANVGPGPDELSALNQVLNELDAVRIAEGSGRFYAGILNLLTGSLGGVGYIGRPTTVSYDLQSKAPVAFAHEFGHTAGRRHAPCGNAANPDVNYPYANATIGTYGFDASTETIYPPSSSFDLMSYCSPRWLSDYTYEGVMNFRNAPQQSGAQQQDASTGAVSDAIVVWGRVENDHLLLQPAFAVRTRVSRPAQGSYRAEGFDSRGTRLFLVSFEPALVADANEGAKQFALAIPLDSARASELAVIRVTGEGRSAERRPGRNASVSSNAVVRLSPPSVATKSVRLSWAGELYPLAVVRDAETGEILALARGGAAVVRPRSSRVEVSFSDGVRSARATAVSEKR